MKVSKENIEVPNECGDFCPSFRKFGYKFPMRFKGDVCYTCPIMNCTKDDEGFCIIDPEDFRVDLAESYIEWWHRNKNTEVKNKRW